MTTFTITGAGRSIFSTAGIVPQADIRISIIFQVAAAHATDALAAMRSVGLTELDLGGQTMRLVSGGGRDTRRIPGVLGIKQINPPSTRETAIDSPKMPT